MGVGVVIVVVVVVAAIFRSASASMCRCSKCLPSSSGYGGLGFRIMETHD